MANQTYQLVITGNSAGQFVQNIFHYRMDDDSFPTRLDAAKGLIDGWLAEDKDDIFLNMVPDTYTMKSVKARRITNGGGAEYIDVSVDTQTGGGGTGTQVSANGPVLMWMTDGGARRIGKTFLPGIANGNINAGEITSAFISTLLDNMNLFAAPFPAVGGTTPTCTFCIPRSNDPSVRSLVVDYQVGKNLGTQRRRNLPV